MKSTAVRPSSRALRDTLRNTVKEAVWFATSRFEQGNKKNIMIFANRRGGSTLLMQMIDSQPGVRSLNEPFSPWLGLAEQIRYLPRYTGGQLVSFRTPGEEAELQRYVARLLSGVALVNAPWDFWRRGWIVETNRIVIKDLEAKPLIAWFDDNFDIEIVLLARHPIPQALSAVSNGWRPPLEPFLESDQFQQQLGTRLYEFACDLSTRGSTLERWVLRWALENYIPLTTFPSRSDSWLFLAYEDIVAHPEAQVGIIAGALQLEDEAKMHRVLEKPSRSSKLSSAETRAEIRRSDTSRLLSRWRDEVSADEEESALRILEKFEIPLYVPGDDHPRPWWVTR